MTKTITLYRPVGEIELDLIIKLEWKKFPPRLPDQPIFYPVLTKEYASKIARDWNAPAFGHGYVLRFKVRKDYLDRYTVQNAGGNSHQEYWIPASKLEEFNNAIVGKIKLIESYQTWFVYILKCADQTLYTGITNDLEKRIQKHNEGKGAKYTRGRGPVSLVGFSVCYSQGEALKLEYKIKKLSRDEKLNYLRKD